MLDKEFICAIVNSEHREFLTPVIFGSPLS